MPTDPDPVLTSCPAARSGSCSGFSPDALSCCPGVVGVDHYEKGDCVFWFRRIVGRHCMNADDTNKGGFPDSDMQEYLNGDVFALLPDELQSVIAVHKTVQKVEGENAEVEGRLFLMSMFEGRGSNDWADYRVLS